MALVSSGRRKRTKSEKWSEIEIEIEGKTEFKDMEKENKRIVFDQLLREILKELDSISLLECARLVSKSWRNEATWILRNRIESCGTTFKFHTEKNKFILFQSKTLEKNQYQSDAGAKLENVKNEKATEKDVAKLTEMFNSCPSHNFPSAHFHFQGGSLDCPQVLEFFAVYGDQVRKLTVDVRKNPLSVHATLRQKIFKLTPKLESLELMDSYKWAPWNWNEPDENIQDQVNLSQNRDQGQGQLGTLKSLKFADSLDCFNRIQKLYKCIQPELPLNLNWSISISTFEIPCNIFDTDLNSDFVFANVGHLVQPINSVALQLFDPDPKTTGQLKQLADSRLRFKYIHVHSSVSRNLSRMSSTDLSETGNMLWKIMDGSREVLRHFYCPVESFFLLTRQPLFPGFLHNLKTLVITFESNHGAQVLTRVSNPSLWKNLSQVAPSLENILLFFFDGECLIESWLPLFDPDAGKHLTVKKLHFLCLGRRELLQKTVLCFPTLTLRVHIMPPPHAMDSVHNLIRWLFLISLENEDKPERNEPISQNAAFCCPFKHLTFLQAMKLSFETCGNAEQDGARKGSNLALSTSQCASSVSNPCFMSKVSGRKWILIEDPEDCNYWREISTDSPAKHADESTNLIAAPSTLSRKVCFDMSCKKHSTHKKI